MEAVGSSETFVPVYEIIRRHLPQNIESHHHYCLFSDPQEAGKLLLHIVRKSVLFNVKASGTYALLVYVLLNAFCLSHFWP